MCCLVNEYLIPYCQRLLQAEILPQKLSRRAPISIFEGSSGKACKRTGTSRLANLRVLAMAHSLEVGEGYTKTPSIWSRCCLKRSAHLRASDRVSTAPCLVWSGARQIVL